jgi:serine/threonine-protein kinase
MGVVYKAEDTRLKRPVALKFLPQKPTTDPEAKERFTHEPQAASALDHPNFCNVYEINETDDGQLFMAMARYEGKTLKKKIERGPLPIDEAVGIATQVAQGLAKAHEHGIVHRDIKPSARLSPSHKSSRSSLLGKGGRVRGRGRRGRSRRRGEGNPFGLPRQPETE